MSHSKKSHEFLLYPTKIKNYPKLFLTLEFRWFRTWFLENNIIYTQVSVQEDNNEVCEYLFRVSQRNLYVDSRRKLKLTVDEHYRPNLSSKKSG